MNTHATLVRVLTMVPALLAVAGCTSHGGRSGPAVAASLTPLQRGAMETKELSGDFPTAFKATISVLQDHGWQIDEVDSDSGLIQASSMRRQDVIGPANDARSGESIIQKTRAKIAKFKGDATVSPAVWTRWERLTAHVEPWGQNTVRLRMTIVRCGTLPAGLHYYPFPKAFGFKDNRVYENGQEQSRIIEDPQTYQLLFQKIQRAIFIRQGLTDR